MAKTGDETAVAADIRHSLGSQVLPEVRFVRRSRVIGSGRSLKMHVVMSGGCNELLRLSTKSRVFSLVSRLPPPPWMS